LLEKASTALQIIGFYLGKLLVPHRLLPDYEYTATSFSNLAAAFGVGVVLLLLMAAVVVVRKQSRLPFFALCWFLAALVPVLHLLPTGTMVADRYVYLASYAWGLMMSLLLVNCYRMGWQRTAIGFAGVVLLVLAGLSYRQSGIWQSEETLWTHTVQVSPRSIKALENLGWINFTRGNQQQAGYYLEQAAALLPGDPVYIFYRGFLAMDAGDYATARTCFADAYAKRPTFMDALYNSAYNYELAGDKPQAIARYREVLDSPVPGFSQFKKLAAERIQLLEGIR
jgi:tetratricopeptide (TPR) repeat protein